jgi:hypothetical protein
MASSDGRDESTEERLDRNWDELLQELRVVQTGIQLLSGFLLTLPFTQVFDGLDDAQKWLYLGLVLLGGIAVIAAVAVLIVGTSVLIFSVVIDWTAGLVAGAALAAVLTTLLGVVPRRLEPH